MIRTALPAALLALSLIPAPAKAQAPTVSPAAAEPAAQPLDRATAARVLDRLERQLARYWDPKIAAAYQAQVRAHRLEYLAIGERNAFAARLTTDLQTIHADGHLRVRNNGVGADPVRVTGDADPAAAAAAAAAGGHGLSGLRRLPGNIGYLKLNLMERGDGARTMIDAAMTLLGATDALILDLRDNGGGGDGADERLLGLLSPSDAPIPMVHITYRLEDGRLESDQRRVDTASALPRYDRPVYVLTSRRTGSAAEALSLDIQAGKRGLLVGEPTAGAGNPSSIDPDLGDGFSAFVANGRLVHPVTGAGFEGAGVQPDVAAPAADALRTAYELALKAVKPSVVTTRARAELDRARADPAAALARGWSV